MLPNFDFVPSHFAILIGIDPKTNKLKLSRKVLLPKPEGYVERERRPREDRPDRGERRERRDRPGRKEE